jgi:nucleotide-binding universal stress UspA family protein
MEARGFVPNLERLLLAVDDSANGKFASRVAGMLAGTDSMPTTVLHIADPAKIDKPTPEPKAGKDGGKPAEKKADVEKSEAKKADKKEEKIEEKKAIATGETVKKAAAQIKSTQEKEEKVDAPVDVTTIIHESPHRDFIVEEAKKGYDLMLIGLAKASDQNKEFHESVAALAMGFEGPLAIVATRGELAERPNGKLGILVPVNGTEASRRGAEVAITMARATKAPLTALYVAVRSGKRPRGRTLRNLRHEEAILKDIVAIADGYNMSIRTAVLADDAAAAAIRSECKRQKNNLVVMGVGRRPGDKLFFGDTAAALLKDADCSLLFVAS